MNAMIDASCPKCKKRYGWCGTMANQPTCPRCGFRPPQEELDAAESKMEAIRERQRTNPANADAETLRLQRIEAGLTLRQAAKLLEVAPQTLCDIEQGRQKPSAALAARMVNCYGVGE